VEDAGYPVTMASDSTHVYWADGQTGSIWRVAVPSVKTVGPPELVVSNPSMPWIPSEDVGSTMALDDTHVYWVAAENADGWKTARILKQAKCGGPITVLASKLYYPSGLVPDPSGYIFFTSGSIVYRVAK
jgi:hypothetical protein